MVHASATKRPGLLVRRLQQVSVSLFCSTLERINITPIQYTILVIIEEEDGLDQVSVASRAVLDSSTVGDVLKRLEARGFIMRHVGRRDRRAKQLFITDAGKALLREATPLIEKSREALFAPLNSQERQEFLAMIERLVAYHEAGATGPWQRVKDMSPVCD